MAFIYDEEIESIHEVSFIDVDVDDIEDSDMDERVFPRFSPIRHPLVLVDISQDSLDETRENVIDVSDYVNEMFEVETQFDSVEEEYNFI